MHSHSARNAVFEGRCSTTRRVVAFTDAPSFSSHSRSLPFTHKFNRDAASHIDCWSGSA